jgi:hypothetical protein
VPAPLLVPKPKPGIEPIHNQAAAKFQNRMLLSFQFLTEPAESHLDLGRKEQFPFAVLQMASQNLKHKNKTSHKVLQQS